MIALVDEDETAEEFPAIVTPLSQRILDTLVMHNQPGRKPCVDCQVHMVRNLPGTDLTHLEIERGVVHVELIRDVGTDLIAQMMSQHGTEVARWFSQP
ncbi:hypothetical protein [Microbispora sp. KK1-11]|uniref:hypothetical protein n=1 Tax=Microbispora sp. KK1-11 TaxID=2053005 RepID=UPI00115AD269|nr:hypothetical protein [Microbispora sp. KK1-11]TQS27700.1 hypothetical protein FLW16_19570 [Microbispora sp. KK1-11]